QRRNSLAATSLGRRVRQCTQRRSHGTESCGRPDRDRGGVACVVCGSTTVRQNADSGRRGIGRDCRAGGSSDPIDGQAEKSRREVTGAAAAIIAPEAHPGRPVLAGQPFPYGVWASPMSSAKHSDKTLLVVEDREAERDALAALLRGAGYGVATAADGPEELYSCGPALRPT